MNKGFLYYFIPVFLVVYFLLAFYPLVKKNQGEVFPFFSFKLYSTIDNHFERFDLLVDKGLKTERCLLFKNSSLNKLERKYCKAFTSSLETNLNDGKYIDLSNCDSILGSFQTAHVVIVSGGYIEAERDNMFKMKIVKQIK